MVVTYNRIVQLQNCVKAIRDFDYRNFELIVVNNGSNDGTKDWLDNQDGITAIHQSNLGGAGGFYAGMSYMYNGDFTWLLLLDDDGVPDRSELTNLIMAYDDMKAMSGRNVILNALVANIEKPDEIAFPWARGSHYSNRIADIQRLRYVDQIQPFNGTLIHRSVIQKIGMIKKEMFIWGDEYEYTKRALHNDIGCYTITDAIHYHPKERGTKVRILWFTNKYLMTVKPEKLSHFYYRNMGYICTCYPEMRISGFKFFFANVIYNILHLNFVELRKLFVYFVKGIHNDFR